MYEYVVKDNLKSNIKLRNLISSRTGIACIIQEISGLRWYLNITEVYTNCFWQRI